MSPTPSRARTSPIRAPKSSSSTTGSSGDFDWRMKLHQLSLPLSGRDSAIAVRKEKPSSPIATTRMITATSGEVSGSWLSSLWMPS